MNKLYLLRKSNIVRKIAKAKGYEIIDIPLVSSDDLDFSGIPWQKPKDCRKQ